MSESKGNKKEHTKIGAVIVLIISAVVFLPAGGVAVYQGLLGKDKTPVFGSYNGTKIKYEPNSTFVRAASNLKARYQSQGLDVNNSQASYYIYNQAFNQTILNIAFSDAVNKSGYNVPDSAINRYLVTLPEFMDANGKFSQKLFNQLNENDISARRQEIKSSLVYSRYVEDMFGTNEISFQKKPLYGLSYSSKEAPFISEMGSEKHAFNIASFDTADFPRTEAVKYGKANAELFTKYEISSIDCETEKAAKEVLKLLKSGEITFEDAVTEKSTKHYSTSDGKLANPYRYQLSSMVENEDSIPVILSVETGAYSAPVQTKTGYSVFRKDSEPVAADFNDDSTVDVVMTYLKNNEMGYIEEYYTNIAKDFASEAKIGSFDRACSHFNAEKEVVEAFPVNYGNSNMIDGSASNPVLSTVANNADVLQTLFALAEDSVSDPFVLDGKILVAKCTSITYKDSTDLNEIEDLLSSADQTSLQQVIMTSEKCVNNFMETYFQYFMNNND